MLANINFYYLFVADECTIKYIKGTMVPDAGAVATMTAAAMPGQGGKSFRIQG